MPFFASICEAAGCAGMALAATGWTGAAGGVCAEAAGEGPPALSWPELPVVAPHLPQNFASATTGDPQFRQKAATVIPLS
jgi:hypothetical protein